MFFVKSCFTCHGCCFLVVTDKTINQEIYHETIISYQLCGYPMLMKTVNTNKTVHVTPQRQLNDNLIIITYRASTSESQS